MKQQDVAFPIVTISDNSELHSLFEQCLKEIDFNRIETAMKAVDWKWFDVGHPNVDQMKEMCRRLFKGCLQSLNSGQLSTYHGCGGFVVEISADRVVTVRFELQSWEAWN